MPRKKKEPAKKNYSQKTISYTMPPDVVEAIEKIMSTYGERTMSKTIGMCVLNFHSQRERIKELQDELYKVKQDKRYQDDNVKSFAKYFHLLTRDVLHYQQNEAVAIDKEDLSDAYDEETFDDDFEDDDD